MTLYLRQFAFKAAFYTGIIRVFQFLHRNHIAILMIHGVMDDTDNPLWKPLRPRLSRDKLEEYLRILSRRYNFISLSDAVDMLTGQKPMMPYSIVLTFDDGYGNNFTHVLPILKRYHAPATFYVPAGFINNPGPFWWDRLDYALQQVEVDGREVKIGSLTMRLENCDRETLRESFQKMRRAAKEQKMSDIDFIRDMDKLSIRLEQESGRRLSEIQNEDDWSGIVTWDQIAANNSDDVTIGSHTVDHIRLGLVEKQVAGDQLSRSKQEIETRTGKECLSISYPNGSINDETPGLAKECGYKCGVTTDEGLNKIGDDIMTLKRINVPTDMDNTEFLALISGVSISISNIKRCIAK